MKKMFRIGAALLALLLLCASLTVPALATDAAEGLVIIYVTGKNGKKLYGFADQNGNTVIPAEYEDLLDFQFGVAAARKEGKWGFINAVGQTVIPFEYDDISSWTQGGHMEVVKDSLHGVIDKTGQIRVSIKYDDLFLPDTQWGGNRIWELDLVLVAIRDANGDLKWGTTRFLPIMYDEVQYIEYEGVQYIQRGKFLVGMKDSSGTMHYGFYRHTLGEDSYPTGIEEVIPVEYDWIGAAFTGIQYEDQTAETVTYFPVMQRDQQGEEKYGCFDEAGNIVLEVAYSRSDFNAQVTRLKSGNQSAPGDFSGGTIVIAGGIILVAIILCAVLVGKKRRGLTHEG